jgi:streptogramin lyase
MLASLLLIGLCLVQSKSVSLAAPVPGIDVTYTSDADFDKGTLMNLNHDETHQQLQLSTITTPFPFVNIANSGRGTLVRIDVNTGTILGEYYTAPNGMGRNPSRTTVDQFGNVWVSNRDESGTSGGVSKGSITRLGLIIGGTRVNGDGSTNPSGQFLKPPFQYNTCIDRNGDGLIKTSYGSGNMLGWSNTGGVDTHGGVTTADDECIINYTRVVATNTRTVVIDSNNDIWVGGANSAHEKVNGITGQPIAGTQFNYGCGGYGGVLDKNGVLWSARFGSGLLRYDTKTRTGACLGNGRGDYGLGVDPNTGEIWHTFLEGNRVAKLAPNGNLIAIYSHDAYYAQGVVVDRNSNVWIANSLYDSSVSHLRTNGTIVGKISTGSGPTGVAVDANGKVWATNYYGWTASRIDPNAGATGGGGFKIGAVDKTVNLGTNAYPYNYSDMTGYVLIGGTSPQGSWSVVQDSGVANNKWGTITWNKESQGAIPTGAAIIVEARTSNTESGLGGVNFTAVSSNQPFSLAGRYIEVRVTLKANSSGQKPVLSDLRISMTPISNVRVVDTIASGNVVVNPASFVKQPYSITSGSDTSIIEWRFDAFTIDQIQDLSYTVSLKNPVAGESRLVSHKLEVLYTDINGNPVRNEIGPQYVQVLASQYAASVTTDKQSYGAKENALINARISNLSLFPRTLDAKLWIEDGQGTAVQELATLTGLQFQAGETKNFNGTVFNTGTSYPGGYRARLAVYEGQSQAGTATALFTIVPSIAASGSVVTDKVTYKPNEQVTLTSTVTSQSLNTDMESLSAKVAIALQGTPGTPLYADTKPLPAILPGASTTFSNYWNTGVNPSGTYVVTLELYDAAGGLLSSSTREFTIASTTRPTALLKGTIALDKQSVLTGEPVTASYTLTNAGNVDLSAIAVTIQTISTTDETVSASFDDQATLAMGATHTNSGMIDTQNYGARDYLVVLRATVAGVEETLAGTFFRIEGAPSAPALSAPTSGSDVLSFTPALVVSNAADPNADQLSYEYEVYADGGLTTLAVGGTVPETAGITAWTVSAPLTENATYYWRARAYDGKLYGPWMAPATFRVNTYDDPPSAPTISSPVDGVAVSTLTPALAVGNAADPDSESLTYNFQVALDADFSAIVASVKGVASGTGTTSWTVPESLLENGTYYWRAQADDWLVEGPWSATSRFFVNTVNDPPTAPVITAPGNGSTLPALEADIVATNSQDPDSAPLTYFFEVDTVPSFDSAAALRSGTVVEGAGSTAWHAAGLLDNTRYFVRAKANDGLAESPWSTVISFFVNTVNDPPTAPTLANPSNGAGVSVFTPTLSVQNATDLDHDPLTYEFALYADGAKTTPVATLAGIPETATTTAWTVPVTLTENATYYWQARASDGQLTSDWMALASFTVNTANDAPDAPKLVSPQEGSSLATLTPTLAVTNASDPDSESLTYQFEVYAGTTLVAGVDSVPQDPSGVTAATVGAALADNTLYQWRARAFDGELYGPWTNMGSFSVHMPITSIGATIDFDPDTLNRQSKGSWVTVRIELPAGHKPADIDLASIRLEGTIAAEPRPYELGDFDKDGIPDLMVKFDRSKVLSLLPSGEKVKVHVTGKVGAVTFEGVDVIRVIP